MKTLERNNQQKKITKKNNPVHKRIFFFSVIIFSIVTFKQDHKGIEKNRAVIVKKIDKIITQNPLQKPETSFEKIASQEKTFNLSVKNAIIEASKITGIEEHILFTLIHTEGSAITVNDLRTDSKGSFLCSFTNGCSTSLLQLKLKEIIKNIQKDKEAAEIYESGFSVKRNDIKPIDYDSDDYKKFLEPIALAGLYIKGFSSYYFSDDNLKTFFIERNDNINLGKIRKYLEKDTNLIITLFSTDINNEEKINNRIAQSLYIGGYITKPDGLENANYYNLRTITLEGVRYIEKSLDIKIKNQYVYNSIYWLMTSKKDVGEEITKNITFQSIFIQRKNRNILFSKKLFNNIGFYKQNNLQGGYKERKETENEKGLFDIEERYFGENIGKNIIHNILSIYGKKYMKKDLSELSDKERSEVFLVLSKDMFQEILNKNHEYTQALYEWYEKYEIKKTETKN